MWQVFSPSPPPSPLHLANPSEALVSPIAFFFVRVPNRTVKGYAPSTWAHDAMQHLGVSTLGQSSVSPVHLEASLPRLPSSWKLVFTTDIFGKGLEKEDEEHMR